MYRHAIVCVPDNLIISAEKWLSKKFLEIFLFEIKAVCQSIVNFKRAEISEKHGHEVRDDQHCAF